MDNLLKQESRVYTVKEIAKLLKSGRNSAYALVKDGNFKIMRIGNSIRISKKSFDEWMNSVLE